MTLRLPAVSLLVAALAAAVPAALAQDYSGDNEKKTQEVDSTGMAAQRTRVLRAKKAEAAQASAGKAVEQYPEASRVAPAAKASAKLSPKLQKLVQLYDGDKPAEANAVADEIIGHAAANAYDKAFASQIKAQVAYDGDDMPGAMAALRQALAFDGLDNNGHYGAMFMLGQLQLQEDQYAEGLATLDRFLAETGSQKPEHLVMKGNALYRLERYPEAAAVLKQAIDAAPEPKNDWQQLLMASYFEMDRPAEAAKIAEALAAKNPNDKRLQLNLAAIYQQADLMDKSVAVLEKLRASGQLTEDKEYRQLYSAYLNMDGKELPGIAVINEGLQKGVLKPDHQVYVALGQAYYYADQPGPAIEAYRKAAPLARDGETYLNLARLLWAEDRLGEAKQAAKQALAKGVKKPQDANKILAQPGG
jgi:tetratricopeptide (TPR) repeat protein